VEAREEALVRRDSPPGRPLGQTSPRADSEATGQARRNGRGSGLGREPGRALWKDNLDHSPPFDRGSHGPGRAKLASFSAVCKSALGTRALRPIGKGITSMSRPWIKQGVER
jgi:hypothetical protein